MANLANILGETAQVAAGTFAQRFPREFEKARELAATKGDRERKARLEELRLRNEELKLEMNMESRRHQKAVTDWVQSGFDPNVAAVTMSDNKPGEADWKFDRDHLNKTGQYKFIAGEYEKDPNTGNFIRDNVTGERVFKPATDERGTPLGKVFGNKEAYEQNVGLMLNPQVWMQKQTAELMNNIKETSELRRMKAQTTEQMRAGEATTARRIREAEETGQTGLRKAQTAKILGELGAPSKEMKKAALEGFRVRDPLSGNEKILTPGESKQLEQDFKVISKQFPNINTDQAWILSQVKRGTSPVAKAFKQNMEIAAESEEAMTAVRDNLIENGFPEEFVDKALGNIDVVDSNKAWFGKRFVNWLFGPTQSQGLRGPNAPINQ